jgi:hypothetical protein
MDLTAEDLKIFKTTLETGNLNIFTLSYFVLPYSGTRYNEYTDAIRYTQLYDHWHAHGEPEEFQMAVDDTGRQAKFSALHEPNLVFLHHHGYKLLPWADRMVSSGRRITVVCGGTGCGKTSARAVIALARSALMEGYDFLNVAPTETQATDMIVEATKWVTGTPFEKFVKKTRGGELFKQRPFPTMIIQVGKYPSTFGCMTIGRHGDFILGKGKDEIHVDEAGLVEGINEAIPRLVTRLRGTRANGRPRAGKMGFSSNPHDNPSFDRLIEKAIASMEDPNGKYFFCDPSSADNTAITEDQLDLQRELIDDPAEQARWLTGDRSTVSESREIPGVLIRNCHKPWLDELMETAVLEETPGHVYHHRDGMGITHWQLPYDPDKSYLAFGDPGTANPTRMKYNNVPVTLVFNVTEFPSFPAEMAAFHWIDGHGKYDPWKSSMREMMATYNCMGYYDGTGTQTAFAESLDFEGYMLIPVSLGGGNKPLAETMFKLFCGDGLLAWPYLEGLWYQARIYRKSGPGIRNLADDILSTMFVASYVLRALYHHLLPQRYTSGDDDDDGVDDDFLAYLDELSEQKEGSRYSRMRPGRYVRRQRRG